MEQVRVRCKLHGICNTGRCKGMTTDHLPICFMHLDPPTMQLQPERKSRKCGMNSGTCGCDNAV